MIEDTKQELQEHIFECAQNYGRLESVVVLQNQKIDTLAVQVREIHGFLTGAVGYLIVGLLGVLGFLVQHYVIK